MATDATPPSAYDEFAPYFDALVAASGSSVRQGNLVIHLLRRVGLNGGCNILDLGCGPGRVLAHLASQTNHTLTGLDASGAMIELARDRAPTAALCRGSWLYEHEVVKQRSPFDAVYSLSLSLPHCQAEEVPVAIDRVFNLLAGDGVFFMDVRPWAVHGRLVREPGRLENVWREVAILARHPTLRWIDDRCSYSDSRQHIEYRVCTASGQRRLASPPGRYSVSYNLLRLDDYAKILKRGGFRSVETLQTAAWPYVVLVARKDPQRDC